MYILIAILLFGLLIFIHELGHYLAARAFNIEIYEFSIGMGPIIFSKKSEKTNIAYSLRLLPIGGYLSMAGEDEKSDSPNAFDKKPVWQRMIVTVAGAAFNILLGFIVMFILVINMKDLGSTQISKFHDGAYSQSFGVQVGDVITEVEGHRVHIPNELSYFVSRFGGADSPVDIKVIRNGKEIDIDDVVFARPGKDQTLYYGCDFYVNYAEKNFVNVMKEGFFRSTFTIRIVLDAFVDMISGKYGIKDLSGPVGVTGAISNAAKEGSTNLWTMFVLLAMNLGIMNLLPFPALDGGRMIALLIELITRRPVNKNIEGYINFVGMMILFGFMILITLKDIGVLIQQFMEK